MVYCQSDSTVYNRHAVGRRVHVALIAYRRETRYKFDNLTVEKSRSNRPSIGLQVSIYMFNSSQCLFKIITS
jgi:hypothetical protein